MPANMTFQVILHQNKNYVGTISQTMIGFGRLINDVKSKTTCRPLVLDEQARMLQTYDPCNLMSNPSSIKFLSRRGNRHINKNKI